jgi:hypothetical protein
LISVVGGARASDYSPLVGRGGSDAKRTIVGYNYATGRWADLGDGTEESQPAWDLYLVHARTTSNAVSLARHMRRQQQRLTAGQREFLEALFDEYRPHAKPLPYLVFAVSLGRRTTALQLAAKGLIELVEADASLVRATCSVQNRGILSENASPAAARAQRASSRSDGALLRRSLRRRRQ